MTELNNAKRYINSNNTLKIKYNPSEKILNNLLWKKLLILIANKFRFFTIIEGE